MINWLLKQFIFPIIYEKLTPDLKDVLKAMKTLCIRDVLEIVVEKTESKGDDDALKWEEKIEQFIRHGNAKDRLLQLSKKTKTSMDDKLVEDFFNGLK